MAIRTRAEIEKEFSAETLPFHIISPPDALNYVRNSVNSEQVASIVDAVKALMERKDFSKELLWRELGTLFIGRLGGDYVIVDGVHRYKAYEILIKEYPTVFSEDDQIPVLVKDYGSDISSYIKDSFDLNTRHGIGLSPADRKKSYRRFFLFMRQKLNMNDYYDMLRFIEETYRDFNYRNRASAVSAVDDILDSAWKMELEKNVYPELNKIFQEFKSGKLDREQFNMRIESFIANYVEKHSEFPITAKIEEAVEDWLYEREAEFEVLEEEDLKSASAQEEKEVVQEEEAPEVKKEDIEEELASVGYFTNEEGKKDAAKLYKVLQAMLSTVEQIGDDLMNGVYSEESLDKYKDFILGVIETIEENLAEIRDLIEGNSEEEEEEE